MKIFISIILASMLFLGIWFFQTQNSNQENEQVASAEISEQAFLSGGLETNTSKHSIELSEIFAGLPSKDLIPAINEPQFISTTEAQKEESLDKEGLVVKIGNTARFYPYTILVWHEIVNDIIEDIPVAITFCPLCGSGIVFDRRAEEEILEFGVSGKLWESNLLMYDSETQSLWSQAIGQAVVGEKTGKSLTIIDSDLITLNQFVTKYPQGEVLSRNTGFDKTYGYYPYGDYENNDDYLFSVSTSDNRYSGKEIMYIVSFNDKSIAFPRKELISMGSTEISIQDITLKVTVSEGQIIVVDSQGNTVPGYHEMWFSWATHHQNDGIVWEK